MMLYAKLVAAIVLLTTWPLSAIGDTHTAFEGKQYQPSKRECIKALENGNAFSLESGTRGIKVYIFYSGSAYLIMAGGGQVSCLAWKM